MGRALPWNRFHQRLCTLTVHAWPTCTSPSDLARRARSDRNVTIAPHERRSRPASPSMRRVDVRRPPLAQRPPSAAARASRRGCPTRAHRPQRISSTRVSTCRAAPDPRNATNASAAGRDGPTVDRTTNHWRCGSPPRGRIVPSSPMRSSSAADGARHQPDPEPRARRLAHRGVGPQRQHRRARARAGAATPPPSPATPTPARAAATAAPASSSTATQRRLASGSSGAVTSTISLTAERLAAQPLVVGHAAGDRDVRPVVEQPGEDLAAVADVQVDVELGVRVAERADELRDDVVARRRHRADAQRRALARRPPRAPRARPARAARARAPRTARTPRPRRSAAARGRRARAASRRPRARAPRPPPTPTAA